jgi:hypothetical protein
MKRANCVVCLELPVGDGLTVLCRPCLESRQRRFLLPTTTDFEWAAKRARQFERKRQRVKK